jgi:sorting nexin-1/2
MDDHIRNLRIGDDGEDEANPRKTDPPVAAKKDDKDDGITFDITVGDPIKVGDITNAHTVYTVHTKTSSPQFAKGDVSVTRRYRDFRWLFHALEHSNPGVIVPPPPDKQAVGRFNNDFVEQRRLALENMLNKIAKHPRLRTDNDFRLFLESDQFAADIKTRVVSPDELEATQSSGFMGALGGVFTFQGKFIESNPWFSENKISFDTLESQLKSLSKALDLVINERRELAESTSEFAATLDNLAAIEVSRSLSELIQAFSAAHLRIRDVYSRQCMQDMMSLGNTIDEYIRIISSVRSVFSQRQNLYFSTQNASQELSKKRASLEKHMKQAKTQQDKIRALEAEVDAQEKKVLNLRVAFDDISKLIIHEVERIDVEKIIDFRDAVELFLENAVEAQKETIEIWETFYQRSFPPE